MGRQRRENHEELKEPSGRNHVTEGHDPDQSRAWPSSPPHQPRDYAGHHDRPEPLGTSPRANEPSHRLHHSRQVTRCHTISECQTLTRRIAMEQAQQWTLSHAGGDPTNPLRDPALDTRAGPRPARHSESGHIDSGTAETTGPGTLSERNGPGDTAPTLTRRPHPPAAMNECAPAHQSTALL